MDVRCERCKTEYELEDARITEAGTAVRCTSCQHVFMVKKKTLVVTVPLRPGQGEAGGLPLTVPATPVVVPPERSREWRVRQADGQVIPFRELTTLQKWIVERKVGRDDEISLNGESWKRLGSIAELSSFFQVVEEAQRAAQLRTPEPPTAAPEPLTVPEPAAPFSFELAEAPAPAPTLTEEPLAAHVPPRVAVPPTPRRISAEFSAEELQALQPPPKRGPLWILAAALLGAAALVYYFRFQAPAAPEPAPVAVDAGAAAPTATEKPSGGAAPAMADAGTQAPDAGAPKEETATAPPALIEADAGVPSPGPAPPQGQRGFDDWMKEGDRQRLRERTVAALSAYQHAILLAPDRAEPYAGKALVQLDKGDTVKAEATFNKALSLDPRSGVAMMGLAETYRIQGRTDEALRAYARYLQVLPNGPEAPVARRAIQQLKK